MLNPPAIGMRHEAPAIVDDVSDAAPPDARVLDQLLHAPQAHFRRQVTIVPRQRRHQRNQHLAPPHRRIELARRRSAAEERPRAPFVLVEIGVGHEVAIVFVEGLPPRALDREHAHQLVANQIAERWRREPPFNPYYLIHMSQSISVFGLGYVGCVSAACFAKEGHSVVGVDVSQSKVDMINGGVATIVEQGIAELVKEVHAAGSG